MSYHLTFPTQHWKVLLCLLRILFCNSLALSTCADHRQVTSFQFDMITWCTPFFYNFRVRQNNRFVYFSLLRWFVTRLLREKWVLFNCTCKRFQKFEFDYRRKRLLCWIIVSFFQIQRSIWVEWNFKNLLYFGVLGCQYLPSS